MSEDHPNFDAKRAAIDATLAEYNTLREEILFRMRAADYFAVLALAGLSAAIGIASEGSDLLFLGVSYLASMSGILYLNQLLLSRRVGHYIATRIEPRVARYTGMPDALSWEGFVRTVPHVWPWPRPVLMNTVFFVALAGVALGLSAAESLNEWTTGAFWFAALGLVPFILWAWWYAEMRPYDPDSPSGGAR